MKASALIAQYNMERPNEVDDAVKLKMLKKCEHMIINEVILTHEHPVTDEKKIEIVNSTLKITSGDTLQEHLDSFGMDTELIVPEPYEEVYIHFLDQKIAYNNNDIKRYNVAATQYNNAMLTYQQWYNRTNNALRAKVPLINHSRI